MSLRPGIIFLAEKLQEAADALTSSAIRARLADAVRDYCRDNRGGRYLYGYCIDYVGDDNAGEVIYSCDDDTYKAPYTMSGGDAAAVKCTIDFAKAVEVIPRTIYELESPEAVEAKRKTKPADSTTPAPFADGEQSHEGETDEAAKPAAGDPAAVPVETPAHEAATEAEDVDVTEAPNQGSIIEVREGAVGQDGTVLLKVIAPGWGSSGYYSEDMLERDLPNIYPAGTKNYWNHQTEAEERARPEGDLRDLASVTTEAVKYMKAGPDGPGGYVRAKAFETFKQPIEDLHKYIGTSIRARGMAKEGVAPDGKKGRLIEKLTQGISIDYVTTAGAGGKVLQLFEAARGGRQIPTTNNEGGGDMSATELQKLQEANRNIARRLARTDAERDAKATLSGLRLQQASKDAILERALVNVPITEAGDFDGVAFKPILEAEIKYAASFIPGGAQVVGVGTAQAADPKVSEAAAAANLADRNRALDRSARQMGIRTEEGLRIFREGRRAFDSTYNSADKRLAVGMEA